MSFGKSKQPDTSQITGQGSAISAAGAITPQEQSQYQGSFGTGEQLQALYKYLSGLGQAPSGYQQPFDQYQQQGGPMAQASYNQVLGQIQNPNAYYQSTLEPQLQLVQDRINAQMQQRGLLQSGLNIEQMGRAGAELAIQEANNRLAFQQQALGNATGLTQQMIGNQGQGMANLANLYGQQQQYGLQAKGRGAQAAQQAAPYYAYPQQAQLGQFYGQQAGNQAGMYGLGKALIGAGGTIGAAMLAPATGGLSLAAIPAKGSIKGGGVGAGLGAGY